MGGTALWISWTDAAGNEGSARWGSDHVTNTIIDKLTDRATELMGEPDTIE